jgi:hypothetical protein
MSSLTVSIIGFLILFSVASYLATREDHLPVDSEKSGDNITRNMTDSRLRFLTTLEDPVIIIRLLMSSLIYLIALLVCLINLFVQSYVVLYIDLFITLIATLILFYVFCKILWKAKVVDTKEVEEFFDDLHWLKGKDNS